MGGVLNRHVGKKETNMQASTVVLVMELKNKADYGERILNSLCLSWFVTQMVKKARSKLLSQIKKKAVSLASQKIS